MPSANIIPQVKCAICCEAINEYETICNHSFCFECLIILSKTDNICPVCNENITRDIICIWEYLIKNPQDYIYIKYNGFITRLTTDGTKENELYLILKHILFVEDVEFFEQNVLCLQRKQYRTG